MSTEATAVVDATKTAATTTQAVTPNFGDWRKADGTINHESFKALPEDIRYLGDSLSKYKTDVDLFRGIANQQTMAGKKGLIPLPANAPAEAVAERKTLLDSINGVPKEAKDYGFKRPDDLPEGMWSDQQASAFAAWAHENSVSPAAAQKLIRLQADFIKGQAGEQQTYEKNFYDGQAKAFSDTIRSENIPTDKADAMALTGAAALVTGFDAAKPEHEALLKNATMKLAFMRHAMSTGEDTYVSGENGKLTGGDPEADAKDIMHNKANPLYAPLYDARHPQHKLAKEKVDQLLRQATAKRK